MLSAPRYLMTYKDMRALLIRLNPDVHRPSLEHVVPRSFYIWPKHNASRDAHNCMIIPSGINSHRSNFIFSTRSRRPDLPWTPVEITGNHHHHEEAYKSTVGGVFEPPSAWRGRIARKVMYFQLIYWPHLHPSLWDVVDPDLLMEWDEDHPVTEGEYTEHMIVSSIQGNRNPFVDDYADHRRSKNLAVISRWRKLYGKK